MKVDEHREAHLRSVLENLLSSAFYRVLSDDGGHCGRWERASYRAFHGSRRAITRSSAARDASGASAARRSDVPPRPAGRAPRPDRGRAYEQALWIARPDRPARCEQALPPEPDPDAGYGREP